MPTNMELLKQIVEDKKNKKKKKGGFSKEDKPTGTFTRGINSTKRGGAFDK